MTRPNAAPGQSASPSPAETRGQISVMPRWLQFSGLPQALGATRWAVFQAIVQLDHQTLGLASRRIGRDAGAFAAPQRDLVAITGLNQRTVGRTCQTLATTHLLGTYSPGGGRLAGAGGRWCKYAVNRDTMAALAQYALPRIMPLHGGIRGQRVNDLPRRGMRIYGLEDLAPLLLSTEELFLVAHRSGQAAEDPGDPDVVEVARICGL